MILASIFASLRCDLKSTKLLSYTKNTYYLQGLTSLQMYIQGMYRYGCMLREAVFQTQYLRSRHDTDHSSQAHQRCKTQSQLRVLLCAYLKPYRTLPTIVGAFGALSCFIELCINVNGGIVNSYFFIASLLHEENRRQFRCHVVVLFRLRQSYYDNHLNKWFENSQIFLT